MKRDAEYLLVEWGTWRNAGGEAVGWNAHWQYMDRLHVQRSKYEHHDPVQDEAIRTLETDAQSSRVDQWYGEQTPLVRDVLWCRYVGKPVVDKHWLYGVRYTRVPIRSQRHIATLLRIDPATVSRILADAKRDVANTRRRNPATTGFAEG